MPGTAIVLRDHGSRVIISGSSLIAVLAAQSWLRAMCQTMKPMGLALGMGWATSSSGARSPAEWWRRMLTVSSCWISISIAFTADYSRALRQRELALV